MSSISMEINLCELGMACKSCDNCKYSDILEDGMMVCFADIGFNVQAVSSCHVCHYWKGLLE